MDFYNEIVNKSDEEVRQITRKRIEMLEEEKDSEEENTIGYKIDYNPEYRKIDVIKNEKSISIESRCFYYGYMKKHTKVVYGLKYTCDGEVSNEGDYYNLDDDSYIYEFTNYLKDKEIYDEYDLVYYVLLFLREYFKTIKINDRRTMNTLIYKDDNLFFPPIRKHELTDFKGQGNALCSEYATMTQNLLSILNIPSSIIIGNEKTTNQDAEPHAFNIIELYDEETCSKKTYLADFLNIIYIYDINFEKNDIMPFLGEIENFTDEFLEDLIYGRKSLEYDNYSLLCVGDSISKLSYETTRSYYIDNVIGGEKVYTK